MKKILSLLLIIFILLSLSLTAIAEPDVSDDSSVSSEESSSDDNTSASEDISSDESSSEKESSNEEPSGSTDTSSEVSSSQESSSSTPSSSMPVSSNQETSVPLQSNSSSLEASSSESSEDSASDTANTKIFLSTDAVVISGNENALAQGTEIKIEQIKTGVDYDKAFVALSDISKQFSLCRIYVADNSISEPESRLTAAFAIPALYDMSKVAVFSISDDGTAQTIAYTLNRKNANITATLKNFGMYAVVELNEVVNTEEKLFGDSNLTNEIFVIITAAVLLLLAAATVVVYTLNEKRKS